MTRAQALISALLGIVAISAALTWMYGPWAVVGGGIVLLGAPFAVDIDKEG